MKKTQKILYKILKIIWIIIGVLISVWTGSIYLKMSSPTGLGVIAGIILFTIGIYAIFIYAGITLLFLLIKFIVKRIIRKNYKSKSFNKTCL